MSLLCGRTGNILVTEHSLNFDQESALYKIYGGIFTNLIAIIACLFSLPDASLFLVIASMNLYYGSALYRICGGIFPNLIGIMTCMFSLPDTSLFLVIASKVFFGLPFILSVHIDR